MPGALEGLRVLDLSSHSSAPCCGMLLGDHGADVIKIERPGVGDDALSMSPHVSGERAPFLLWNRNKRSIELDLKAEGARHSFWALVDGGQPLGRYPKSSRSREAAQLGELDAMCIVEKGTV